MTIIDLVKNEGSEKLLAWKYPMQSLSTWTQLIVGEGETAVLFTDRKAADLFTAGRHTLETANLPLLSGILRLPFGGRSPFEAEIWYVNMREVPDIKWGTDTPVQLVDDSNGILLSLRGYGQFGVRIDDPSLFLTSFCRNLSEFGGKNIIACFRGPMMAVIKDCIVEFMRERGGITKLGGGLMELSAMIKAKLEPEFSGYGISLTGFYVSDLSLTPDNSGVEQLRMLLARKEETDELWCKACNKCIKADWTYCPYCGKQLL